jgi:hypothetical protein
MSTQQNTDAGGKPENHVEVVVVTTSGLYPTTGTDRVAANQPVKVQLEKALKALKIVDATNWVATANANQIDLAKSYADNGLSGTVSIDYGPNHGGGGGE